MKMGLEKPLMVFRGVRKAFDGRVVLGGVDLELPVGRRVFVVGPSGAGKSLLMKTAVGFVQPDAGEVSYLGQAVPYGDPAGLLALRRRCVYVFQHPALMDSMSALENIRLVLSQRGLDWKRAGERASSLLAELEIGELADLMPAALSAGQQKLVSIARAMSLQPETLILDEPTTALDPLAASQVDRLLEALPEGQTNLVVISHDLRSVRRLADQVVMVEAGSLRFQGTAQAFLQSEDAALKAFREG
jgi:ABC-type transporter Mla maintaining outer membrane lipid asymmetry ATPase subunit MlaF